jgi:hypothetical protein
MSHTVNDIYLENKREQRGMWLSEFGLDEGDVMTDETGTEYVFEKLEGEYDPYDEMLPINTNKVVLPLELQKDYYPF